MFLILEGLSIYWQGSQVEINSVSRALVSIYGMEVPLQADILRSGEVLRQLLVLTLVFVFRQANGGDTLKK